MLIVALYLILRLGQTAHAVTAMRVILLQERTPNMPNEKHTPGPWKWTNGDYEVDHKTYESPGYYENLHLEGPNGETIVGCGEYDVFGKVEDRCLLQAAPALLEALKQVIQDYDEQDYVDNDTIIKVKEALRLAEGGNE